MKRLIFIVCSMFSMVVYAGSQPQIPVELVPFDNQGRVEFLRNALQETGFSEKQGVKYQSFNTFIIGGDESDADFTGAFFIYEVTLTSEGQSYACYQFLAVGSMDPSLTRSIHCQSN